MNTRHNLRRSLAALPVVLAAGCAVGPDFKPPAPPSAPSTTRQPVAASSDGSQRFEAGARIRGDWWTLFKSEPLNRLVAGSMTNNPSIDAARAALRQAIETTSAQRGFYFPAIQASYAPSRQRNAVGTISPTLTSGQETFSLHSAQLSVGYVFDVFGANRRAVEGLAAQEEVQLNQLRAAELTVSSGVVAAAIQEASLRAQIDAARRIIGINTRLLEVLRRQREIGFASGLDVAAQESALAQAEQALPSLERQWEQTRDAVAAMAGRPPSDGSLPSVEISDLQLPASLPLSLPSAIVRQRPDVLAAEAQLHAASAAVGVAVAARIPQLSLTANAGGTATKFADMFASGDVFWSLSGNVAQTVFDGGTLRHRERAARAALESAEAQYRSTVITVLGSSRQRSRRRP
jgi:NodT family efflux transporter outer membrane factor (OMF) lipoprotein